VDPSDDGLAADGIADQVWIAQRRRRIVCGQDVGNRRTRRRGSLLGTCLEFHARVHVVGRTGTQNQSSTSICDRIERPRGPTGAACQGVQVLDDDPVAQYGAQHGLELFLHLRPNPKSRCATRRIWISSAPSVIRYRR
jgi:hypothetical protein